MILHECMGSFYIFYKLRGCLLNGLNREFQKRCLERQSLLHHIHSGSVQHALEITARQGHIGPRGSRDVSVVCGTFFPNVHCQVAVNEKSKSCGSCSRSGNK